jgi:hypothetical protein
VADNYNVKDAAEATIAIASEEIEAGVHSPRVKASGYISNPSANFTRPADTTTYAVGDLVANSTTAGLVVPMQFTVGRVAAGSAMIRRVKLLKTGTTLTNANFRLHLYRSAPTPSNGDNGAWLTGHSGYLGAFDLACDRAFTDGAHGASGFPLNGSEMSVKLASGTLIYGLLEARGAYIPISGEVFTIELETLQN